MELNPSEIHFMKRTLEARQEWIKDNPDDDSIEEDEGYCKIANERINKELEQRKLE